MGRVEGKVAFITGAARGMGRSHALRLAEEGADIIAVDLCEDIPTVDYPMSTAEDLEETVRLVEKAGRRVYSAKADVRDYAQVRDAYEAGVRHIGPVDIVVANAGICQLGSAEPDPAASFRQVIDINLVGVWNSTYVVAGDMVARGQGGSMVLISSTQGLTGRGADGSGGALGYAASKHGVVGLMRSLTNWLSPHNIRVNSVHPTGTATPLAQNEVIGRLLERDPQVAKMIGNLLPVDIIDPVDISNAVLYLASDEGRYVTGVALPVDAGMTVK